MAKYKVEVERTLIETCEVEIEVSDDIKEEAINWPQVIEKHFDANNGDDEPEWECQSVDYDLAGGTEPEKADEDEDEEV